VTAGKKKRLTGESAADFPALRGFFEGYLHQDFRDEYGSAAGAVQAFREDASDSELAAVRKEWKKWRAGLSSASMDEIAQATRKLGTAWQPQVAEDLDHVETALNAK
jgi:CdiI immunity protein